MPLFPPSRTGLSDARGPSGLVRSLPRCADPRRRGRRLALAALIFGVAGAAFGASYEIVRAFGDERGYPVGGLLPGADGALYGTTSLGGVFGRGAVFVLRPDGLGGYAYETLHEFRGPDGAEPASSLTAGPGGALYGTTSVGGVLEQGTIFRIDPQGRFTTLHAFSVGAGPSGSLVLGTDGFLYGLTWTGAGSATGGTFYRIDEEGHHTLLHTFADPEGIHPRGEPVQGTDGAFYGVTSDGGNDFYSVGTVFRIDSSWTLTTLHEFGFVDGARPYAGLCLASDGNLYGTTLAASGWNGTLFRVRPTGVETLHYFDSSLGGSQSHLIQASDGYLYGTTDRAYPNGAVFRSDLEGEVTPVHAFDDSEGYVGAAALVEGANGSLFGVTSRTGDGFGSVFRLDGETVTTLHALRPRDGFYPRGTLIQASDGLVYGVTSAGGQGNAGTIFRIAPSGAYEVVHHFFETSGAGSGWGLSEAGGALYGTTTTGGALHLGTAFRLGLDGAFTTLHSFAGGAEGELPSSGLTPEPGGTFLGVAYGGANQFGVIYRLEADDEVTPLYALPGWPGPAYIFDEPIPAVDGNHYGIAGGGPQPGYGTIYRLDSSDDVTVIHEFDIATSSPRGRLLAGSDGKLYGATGAMLFHIDLSGAGFGSFHTFSGPDGEGPVGGLVEAPDGFVYGTTAAGGSEGLGTIFRLGLEGQPFETLWSFRLQDGITPGSPVLLASDGDLYGTVLYGGAAGYGVLYRFSPEGHAPSLAAIGPSSGRADGGGSVVLSGSHLSPAPAVAFGGTPAIGVTGLDATTIFAMSPPLGAGTLYDVTVTSDDAAPVVLPAAWFADFLDVPASNLYHDAVESIIRAGISAGCGAGNFCVNASVTRAQMAVLLLKAEHGATYAPPPCAGLFDDVPCPSSFAAWIEQLGAEGVTSGCGGDNYCPGKPVTRAQMAVFLLKTKDGAAYVPPAATGLFGDVPPGSFAADWIEDLYARGITGGCSVSPLLYCPGNANTRGQMAVFLVKTFGL